MISILNKFYSLLPNVSRLNHMHVRSTHNTLSYQYVKRYFADPEHGNQFIKVARLSSVFQFPKTVENILKLESTFRKQKLVTLVHATPSAFTPAIVLATECAVRNTKPPQKNAKEFAVLRAPGDYQGPYEEAMKIIQVLNDPNCGFYDHTPKMSNRAASMNYGLFTNIQRGEAAFNFGFSNVSVKGLDNFDFAPNTARWMIGKTLRHYGLAEKEIGKILSSPLMEFLLEDFNSLRSSNFLVFGLDPDFAERFIYDSLPYGEPTEDHPLQVIQGTQGQHRYTGHQARMVIAEETLDPQSPMTVVSAVDQKAVDSYVAKHSSEPFVPPFALEEFHHILPDQSSEIENGDMRRRKALLERTNEFCEGALKKLNL